MMPAPDLSTPAVGSSITLRVETPVGDISVVGVVVAIGDEIWSIRRRDGSITEVATHAVRARRDVPPPPSQRAGVAEVQQVAALGWRALETARLGDWLLRAGGGFTGRANSALTIGEPGRTLTEALRLVEGWYADRGLPPRLQLPDPGATEGIRALLDARDYSWSPTVHMMTAELGHVLRACDAVRQPAAAEPASLHLDDEPDREWLTAYRSDAGELPAVAREVLGGHPSVVFASYREHGHAVAVARAAVDARWVGLSAVEVAPSHRRRGLAVQVCAAALRWAGGRGARQVYLQTEARNNPAVTLYRSLGFAVHHDYRYANGGLRAQAGATPR